MAEKDTIFSSQIKYKGIFSFKDFYAFCHEWLTEETSLDIGEGKYTEKLKGDEKEIEVKWSGEKKFTDYFKFEFGLAMEVSGLKEVEINQKGAKIQTNTGDIKVKVKGVLVKDYAGKFESSGFQKFLRGIYEKWIITSRVGEFEDKVAGDCDKFLGQAKAWLDLEGKK